MPGQPIEFRQNNPGVGTGTADVRRELSPAIWSRCPIQQINEMSIDGIAFEDDFESPPLIGTQTTQIGWGQYKVYATSGSAVTPVSAVNSVDLGDGIAAFTVDASAHQAALAQAYPVFKMSGSKTVDNKIWFECRIAKKSVLTNRNGFMIGLAETNLWTLGTSVPYTSNAGAIDASAAFIGWEQLPADTTSFHSAYTDRATSFTEIGTNQGTDAAFVFTKLGFFYDPWHTTKAVRFYQDGVEQPGYLTPAQLAATTNLKANSLGLIAASVGGSAVSSDAIYLDWWRCVQVGVGELNAAF